MAGIEQLEVHSKSYLVRWVNVKGGHTISWSIKPEKKSINFGIFKHPASGQGLTPQVTSSTLEPPLTPGIPPDESQKNLASSRSAQSSAADKLKAFGLKPISWYGTCEANRVSSGTHDVPKDDGGMYALVFDNTFSKSISKKATFVLMTYPTGNPPQAVHHQHPLQGLSSESNVNLRDASRARPSSSQGDSRDSTKKTQSPSSDNFGGTTEGTVKGAQRRDGNSNPNLFNGVLQKRRRKNHQGWARRYFSLDYGTQTLSYYHDRNSLALRGTVPLSLAAIGANAKTRQISIDSGAEIWHLKASNDRDFEAWKQALEVARTPTVPSSPAVAGRPTFHSRTPSAIRPNPQEEQEWARIETLVARVKSTRELAVSLAKDTDPKYLPTKVAPLEKPDALLLSEPSSKSQSPTEHNASGYFGSDLGKERRPFWKRNPSSERPMTGFFKRSVSATPSTTSQQTSPPTVPTNTYFHRNDSHIPWDDGVHDHCMTLLRDLDAIVADFSQVLDDSKRRRAPVLTNTLSRHSIDSQGSDEFFDAEGFDESQLLAIEPDTDDERDARKGSVGGEEDSGSDSDLDEVHVTRKTRSYSTVRGEAFPRKPDNLAPLPADRVPRRTILKTSVMPPPSLIGFFRKNVGKDLSTISMPVSANEPLSLLQRASEMLEYSALLDAAAASKADSTTRLLLVTAFAVSMISSSRCKERALRKPFNPMLGETFELVREDRGSRFIAEKVTHHPVRMACQAESENWCLTQAPLPSQKFWGKSAEIITEGKYRVVLHSTGDRFSWSPPTSFLRNMIAGEKYVEPVGAINIVNETTNERSVVTFKSKGMFSGRSEDVVAQLYNIHGEEASTGLVGKWTESLNVSETGSARANAKPIWAVGDLVQEANKRYGFTTFASSLNEITALEQGKLPPTDSRRRPDQRAAEDGNLDQAEDLKVKLEEAQRARRKLMEGKGEVWQPRWFKKLDPVENVGEEIWVAKSGADSYWERRIRGNWQGVEDVFSI